jgi:CHAT domain-containing protein
MGKETAGEGYIGLAHAFLQAGARSLLVSLWKVGEEATALLMTRFYENLTGAYDDDREGRCGEPMSKAEALREAKRWLRTYSEPSDGEGEHWQPFRHPSYWSGFVLIGEP